MGKNYWRVRIGIDHPGDKNKVSNYVLSPFSKKEKEDIDFLKAFISDHILLLLKQEHTRFLEKCRLNLDENVIH